MFAQSALLQEPLRPVPVPGGAEGRPWPEHGGEGGAGAPGAQAGAPGRGVGSAPPGSQSQLRRFASFPVRVDFGKSQLCFPAGSPAWPGKISAKPLRFAPKQETRASAGQAPGLVRGSCARSPSWFQGRRLARLPGARSLALLHPDPHTSPLGETQRLGSGVRKNKSSTSTLLDRWKQM